MRHLVALLACGAAAACASDPPLDRYQALLLNADFEGAIGPATPRSGLSARVPVSDLPGAPAGDSLTRVGVADDDDGNLVVSAFFPGGAYGEGTRNALVFRHPGAPLTPAGDEAASDDVFTAAVAGYAHADFAAAGALRPDGAIALKMRAVFAHDGPFDFTVYTGAACEIATLRLSDGVARLRQGAIASPPIVMGADADAGSVEIIMRLDQRAGVVFVAIVNGADLEGARTFSVDRNAGCTQAWDGPWTDIGVMAGFVGEPADGVVMLDFLRMRQ